MKKGGIMKQLDDIIKASLRKDISSFSVGDTVNLNVKIIEGGKEKLQGFKGIVIARRGRGLNETFVVRKISYGEGVERTFYLNSPRIKELKVIKRGKVRRAKLYYLRKKIGKRTKVKELEKETVVSTEDQVEMEETTPSSPETPPKI